MKVLVVGGLSGGHIFPALAFLDALRLKNKRVTTLLVLPKAVLAKGLRIEQESVRFVPTSNIVFKISRAGFLSIIKFIAGIYASLFLLIEFRPDVVVGFGSIVCAPFIILAWVFRIKTLIHEQNVIPGRANRLLGYFSDKIALSFKETAQYLPAAIAAKAPVTGNPLRKDLVKMDRQEAARFFGFDSQKVTILVMGGSLGSRNINTFFLAALTALKEKNDLQVIHLSGARDFVFLKTAYEKIGAAVRLYAFFDQMQYAYSAATLAICRAGASSITEIIAFGLPAIIIPYPYAEGHQTANAQLLQKKGSALLIKDEELSAELLLRKMEELLNDRSRLSGMRAALDGFASPNAAMALAEQVYAD